MKIALIATVALLVGCNATTQQARRPSAADDPTTQCFQRLGEDDRFAALRPKVGSVADSRAATLEMLASTERASDEDKRLISVWGVARQTCVESGRQFRAQYAPPGWAQELENGNTAGLALMARLYAGEITYGEFNRARQELGSRTRSAMNNAATQAQAARQAQAAQAQAETLQTLQIMQMLQPQPAIAPPMLRPPVNCVSRRVGSQVYTDCN